MRHGVGVGVAALAAVAVLAVVIRDRRAEPEPVAAAAPQSSAADSDRSSSRPVAKPTSTSQEPVPSAAVNAAISWQDLLETSSNYLEFVDRALPAAREGDASAQFALYQALEYCEMGYRAFFDRPGKRRTLDEALSWASTRSVNTDEVRDVHRRCGALMSRGTGEVGSAGSWLERASAAGLPAAQARKALDDLRAVELQSAATADRTASTAKEFEEKRASARALLLGALATGDPSATWDAAETIYGVTGSGTTADTEQWVWKLAACMQGYDCAPGAAWVAAFCDYEPNPCPAGESAAEVIRRAWVQASGQSDTSDLDRRARELADLLNSGQFSEEDLSEFMGVRRTP